jgi:hypothetical protein
MRWTETEEETMEVWGPEGHVERVIRVAPQRVRRYVTPEQVVEVYSFGDQVD